MDNKEEAKEVLLGHSSPAELKSTKPQSAHNNNMATAAVENSSHKEAGIFYDPSTNASQSPTQDKKEAVAALSASLTFRRFDNGGTNSTAAEELDSSLASRDSLDASLRQFKETILRRSNTSSRSGSSGKVMTPLRRSFQGNGTSSIQSALSLRRSLPNNSYHSGQHII